MFFYFDLLINVNILLHFEIPSQLFLRKILLLRMQYGARQSYWGYAKGDGLLKEGALFQRHQTLLLRSSHW